MSTPDPEPVDPNQLRPGPMEPLHLIEIGEDGNPTEDVSLTDLTHSVCETTAGLYQRVGFQRPWIGYFAEQDDLLVGMCGFKSPPKDDRVEIAYGAVCHDILDFSREFSPLGACGSGIRRFLMTQSHVSVDVAGLLRESRRGFGVAVPSFSVISTLRADLHCASSDYQSQSATLSRRC